MLSQYVLHRHPKHWRAPKKFDPDRFTPERKKARPKFAYFPYGGGPHYCTGQPLAQLEMKLVVAALARRWRLDLAPGARVEPYPLLSLGPKDGLPMVVRKRNSVQGTAYNVPAPV